MAERRARPRRPRTQPRDLEPAQRLSRGQHFLRSRRFTAELVRAAGISSHDLVVEVGAGRGKITRELAERAARVVAVERDPKLGAHLIDSFAEQSHVLVVVGDALDFPLPAEPFRVFANPPFGITTALLRKLLENPALPLTGADLVVQEGLAIKRTKHRPSRLLNLSWGPWWKLEITRRIPRTAFEPMPSVDAAMLSIRRRTPPLLPRDERLPFITMLEEAFAGSTPIPNPTEIGLVGWIEIFRSRRARVGLA